jgi:hypothetical protein
MAERVVALAVLLATGAYVVTAMQLSAGTAARPGPGFFPIVVGTFAIVASAAWTVAAFRRAPAGRTFPTAAARGRVVMTALVLAGFCLVLPWAGYPLSAFLFVAILLRVLGAGWIGAVATGIAAAVVSYYVFAVLLSAPLPRGVLFD